MNESRTADSPASRVLPAGEAPLQALQAFVDALEEVDRTFLKLDALDVDAVRAWREQGDAARLVALDGEGRICGLAAVHRLPGWSRHVGQVTVAVLQDRRGQGHGGALARLATAAAYEQGLLKLTVEVDAEQTAVIGLFQGLGFAPEALLEGHIRDPQGRQSDLLIMSQHGPDNAALFAAVGLTEGLE